MLELDELLGLTEALLELDGDCDNELLDEGEILLLGD